MPAITKKGRELAWKLNPAIGTTSEIQETCSLIARHATTHHWLMEHDCNYGLSESDEIRVEGLEAHIRELVETLPHTDDGPFQVYFQGDPRGATVKIVVKGHAVHPLYDGFAREAIIVPQ